VDWIRTSRWLQAAAKEVSLVSSLTMTQQIISEDGDRHVEDIRFQPPHDTRCSTRLQEEAILVYQEIDRKKWSRDFLLEESRAIYR
jgi:hypothetical protein